MTSPLLEVRDLSVRFPSPYGEVRAVEGISFSVRRGERLGIVGESGAGKSVTALSIMGLLPPSARTSGEVRLDGGDLLRLPHRALRRIRGKRVAMIFQEPVTCLNPTMTVGDQIAEAIRTHRRLSRHQARREAVDLLGRVGIPAPARRADDYPHRLSGGMAQRVMIAMAISCEPELLIADEPTTALDVTIEAQIVELLASLCRERDMAVILITHDLALEARFADRIAVMYAGRIVEKGPVGDIYYRAAHPYTWGLMSSVTRIDADHGDRLSAIPGNPPSAITRPSGCPFHPRCPHAEEICSRDVPALLDRPGVGHPVACHFAGRLSSPRPGEASR